MSVVVDEAEVVVVGAGPSGAVAAGKLAELGHDVLLIDQSGFPREKPCGDGLTHASIAYLQQLGLGGLVDASQEIEDVRVVIGHDREMTGWYRPWPQPPKFARVTRRFDMDTALFALATSKGARFRQARVDQPHMEDGSARGVVLAGAASSVTARCVIAADGSTSRMRRGVGMPQERKGSRIYALRFYADTSEKLAPVYDIYVPLLYEGGLLAGYGWVFPVQEHRANIGVAYYEPPAGRPRARIREVLNAFLHDLEERSAGRVGALSNMTEPIGAPIATQFSPRRTEVANVIFAGEAARAADPLNGEGISFAMHSGESAADEAHALLTGARRPGQGRRIARRFTRLGQDLTLPARLAAGAATGITLADRRHQPYFHKVRRVTSFAPDDGSLERTEVHGGLAAADPECAVALDRVNDRMLDALQTSFPFALETMHRELRARSGPGAAATAIAAARAQGIALDDRVIDAAAACELALLPIRCLPDLSAANSSDLARLNNSLALLTGSFALARSHATANVAAPELAAELARVSCELIEGCWAEVGERDLTAPRSDALEKAFGGLFELAARSAALATGTEPSEEIARAGRHLGAAWRIDGEIRELTTGDELLRQPPGDPLFSRRVTVPLAYAVDADPELADELESKLDTEAVRRVLSRIERAGGIDRAAAERAEHARECLAAIEAAGTEAPEALRALAELRLGSGTVAAGT